MEDSCNQQHNLGNNSNGNLTPLDSLSLDNFDSILTFESDAANVDNRSDLPSLADSIADLDLEDLDLEDPAVSNRLYLSSLHVDLPVTMQI